MSEQHRSQFPRPDPRAILTLEEFEQLPEEDEYLLELVHGRVVREPRPGTEHGWILLTLGGLIRAHVKQHALGIARADIGVVIPKDPPVVRGPDIAFFTTERMPAEEIPVGFSRVAPDLAVEIVSPSNSAVDIQEKVLDYLDAGTRLVWVVHPRTQTVAEYRTRDDIHVLSRNEMLNGGDVLPGFRAPISELFER